ncbi:MAG: hypothetical protein DRH10_04660 [Deltaproteobacteria bacterium]|nr:MAG: hypothetical protein DRH10_04660 [Deltaproteobacteria bacterium]
MIKMETEIKEFIKQHYKELHFENEQIDYIEEEHDFKNNNKHRGATIDFLGKTTNEKHILIECKGEVDEKSIGQLLKYRVYAKKELKVKDDDILLILLGYSFHSDFFTAYSLIEDSNFFKPFQYVCYWSFGGDKKFYHVFSVPDKGEYQIITEIVKSHQQVRQELIETIMRKRWELITSGDLFITPTKDEIQKLMDMTFSNKRVYYE